MRNVWKHNSLWPKLTKLLDSTQACSKRTQRKLIILEFNGSDYISIAVIEVLVLIKYLLLITNMRKRKKSILVIAIVIVCFIAFAFFGAMLGAGPYGYAEQYKFNTNKDQLIQALKKLKEEDKSLNLPDAINDPDGLDTSNMHYNVSMLDNDQKIIFVFFVEGDYDNSNNAFINLISVNKTLDVKNYKIVNRDMDRAENLQVKKDFEKKILDKLKFEYKDKGNNNFVFWK